MLLIVSMKYIKNINKVQTYVLTFIMVKKS